MQVPFYFETREQAQEVASKLLMVASMVAPRTYTLNVIVPKASSANAAGSTLAALKIDAGGPFLAYGYSMKFGVDEDDTPKLKFTWQNQSKQGYYYFKTPTSLDLVANVGKVGNQFYTPFKPFNDTIEQSSFLQFQFFNSSTTEDLEVEFTLEGFQWNQPIPNIQ